MAAEGYQANRSSARSETASIVVTAIVALSSWGCSTSAMRVDSDPSGADVSVAVPGQAKRKVGQTPYALSAIDQGSGDTALQVSVGKDGFVDESVLVAPAALGRAGQIFVKLNPRPTPPACPSTDDQMERLARGVAEIQALIKSKSLDEADGMLSNLIGQFPNVSVLQDLRGNTHFLRKNYDKALEAYRRSLELYPNNPRTTLMVKRLEDLRGGPR